MAHTPIQSVDSPIEISSDNGVNWKVIICVSSWTVPITTNSTDTATQCGLFVGLGAIQFNPTIQAVCSYEQGFIEASYNDCLTWQVGKTPLLFRVQSPVFGSYALGEAYYLSGSCYVTDTSLIDNTNDPVKFSVTLKGFDALTIH